MPKLNIHDPKIQAAGAAVAGVVAFALYKSHQSAAATSGTTTTSDPTGASSALGDANLQDAVYGSLEDQIGGLAAIVTQLQNTPAPTASSPAPAPVAKPPATKKKTLPKHPKPVKAPPKKPAPKPAKKKPVASKPVKATVFGKIPTATKKR